jgi:hypothetical protein
MGSVIHAPTSRGVPALQRLRMHDDAVGSSQSRGGLNNCDDLVRAGQPSAVARIRPPTPPAQGDDEWSMAVRPACNLPTTARGPVEDSYLLLFWPPVRHGGGDGMVGTTFIGPSYLASEGFGQEPTCDEGARLLSQHATECAYARRTQGRR